MTNQPAFLRDPLWYKDAIIYQIHVRAFYDSNNDGIGDFRGLIEKLDYLKDLGVNTIWLLPFYPSPLKDDGYDIADYERINPMYGDLKDFRDFVDKAHDLGMRVITELVINHTSDQHEWFQRARLSSLGSIERDFYVWSDDPHKYREARIIFKDFEHSNWTYDPVAKSYYWHRFYSHQPDLNFNNPEVKKQLFKLVDYWIDMGVDGMRLDAVPYLYEKEGTSCENLAETHVFLKELRAYIDQRYPDAMLLAEANQWPEDAVAYFGDGDECHMCFHFPVMPRLFMAVKMEDRFSIIDILRQTPDIPDNCQWAMFLRNHDELTLEMVTDEERDYMYSVYASEERARINLGIRRRLAPLLNNDRRQIELLNGLLFSLPGTPIIYYGDELGMGDNIYLGDRNGVRTPFQWSPDRNAGFSKADPQKLYLPVVTSPEYHYMSLNAENQLENPHSFLNWTKKLIELRKQNIAMNRGTIRFLEPENQKVLAFLRTHEDQTILVLANLSKRAQYVELDLSEFKGLTPVELRGDMPFPSIGDLPFLVTLGSYDYYWFELKDITKVHADPLTEENLESEHLPDPGLIFEDRSFSAKFEVLVRDYLPKTRWFSAKDRTIKKVTFTDGARLANPGACILFVDVEYHEQDDRIDKFFMAIASAEGTEAELMLKNDGVVISSYTLKDNIKGVYYDAFANPEIAKSVLALISSDEGMKTFKGTLLSEKYSELPERTGEGHLMGFEQSNTSIRFGKTMFLKVFRRLEKGVNPEIELSKHFLHTRFNGAPKIYGSLSYVSNGSISSIAVLQEFRESEMGGWELVQAKIAKFVENVPASLAGLEDNQIADMSDNLASDLYNLGMQTGAMHVAMADNSRSLAFSPEDITPFYQRSLYQTFRNRSAQALSAVRHMPTTSDTQPLKEELLKSWNEIDAYFEPLKLWGFGGKRIRSHGDFHLGQVLYKEGDFTILDFEGEPRRPISLRRLKNSPLLDVAGMLRSFDYAIFYFIRNNPDQRPNTLQALQKLEDHMSEAYLKGYLDACKDSDLLPVKSEDVQSLLKMFVLYKALYEITYELSSRPDWVDIPMKGILNLLSKGRT